MTNNERNASIYIISGFITILVVIAIFSIGMLFTSCTTDICRIKYNEPDESWYHATFYPDNVISCHSANTKRGTVYWIVYTDLDCEWDNQIISMDKETFYTLKSILKEDNDDIEFSILYKIHYQPVLVLVDRD